MNNSNFLLCISLLKDVLTRSFHSLSSSADNPATTVNRDLDRPYQFHSTEGHTKPMTAPAQFGSESWYNQRVPSPQPPATAPLHGKKPTQ